MPNRCTPHSEIVPAPNNAILEKGGLRLDDSHATAPVHGLVVTRWTEAIGGDVALEVDVSAGKQWSLGVAVDGDSFQGYRIIFIAPDYPNGISVDSIYPVEQTLLAQDPRPIPPSGTIPCGWRNAARSSASGSIGNCGSTPSWPIHWRRIASGRLRSATSGSHRTSVRCGFGRQEAESSTPYGTATKCVDKLKSEHQASAQQ